MDKVKIQNHAGNFFNIKEKLNFFYLQLLICFWGLHILGFPDGASGKESAYQCRKHKRSGFDPWVGKMPWRRKWQPTPVFLPGKFHGQRSLAGYSPWGHKESDMTKQLSTHTHIYTWWRGKTKQKKRLIGCPKQIHRKNSILYSEDHWQLFLDYPVYKLPTLLTYHKLQL